MLLVQLLWLLGQSSSKCNKLRFVHIDVLKYFSEIQNKTKWKVSKVICYWLIQFWKVVVKKQWIYLPLLSQSFTFHCLSNSTSVLSLAKECYKTLKQWGPLAQELWIQWRQCGSSAATFHFSVGSRCTIWQESIQTMNDALWVTQMYVTFQVQLMSKPVCGINEIKTAVDFAVETQLIWWGFFIVYVQIQSKITQNFILSAHALMIMCGAEL